MHCEFLVAWCYNSRWVYRVKRTTWMVSYWYTQIDKITQRDCTSGLPSGSPRALAETTETSNETWEIRERDQTHEDFLKAPLDKCSHTVLFALYDTKWRFFFSTFLSNSWLMAFASFTIGIRSARSSRNNIASEYMKTTGSEFLKLEMFP